MLELWSAAIGGMMLEELRVGGYKGFDGIRTAKLAPLTLVFGHNSAGKSALAQSIVAMSQTLNNAPRDVVFDFSGDLVDLGSLQNSTFRHDPTAQVSFGVKVRRDGERPGPVDSLHTALLANVSYDFALRPGPDHEVRLASAHLCSFGAGGLNVDFVIESQKSGTKIRWPEDSRFLTEAAHAVHRAAMDARKAHQHDPIGYDGQRTQPRDDILGLSIDQIMANFERLQEVPLRTRQFLPDLAVGARAAQIMLEPTGLLHEIVRTGVTTIRRELGGVRYLGPMRAAPQRLEQVSEKFRGQLGARGEGLIGMLDSSVQILSKTNEWLGTLDIPYEVRVERIANRNLPSVGEYLSLALTDRRTNTTVSAKDLGYGISQLLPVIAACVAPSKGPVVIEQPELHLHPRLQAELGKLFARTVIHRDGQQLIVETHSENLILRVQRLVREQQLAPDQVSIVYVGATKGVGSWIENIGLTESGEFTEEWPGGFFNERLEEW
ncbi:MAG: hypothetical protein JW395_3726 [Nitrospira sp.]|nr:hypothetical protein [Nitrospira sp.]